jgi:hypothetical protein
MREINSEKLIEEAFHCINLKRNWGVKSRNNPLLARVADRQERGKYTTIHLKIQNSPYSFLRVIGIAL